MRTAYCCDVLFDVVLTWFCLCCCALQAIKDWAVKMRTAVVPWDTIESCATTAVITGVSAAHARLANAAVTSQV
jgi:hypothetical protein